MYDYGFTLAFGIGNLCVGHMGLGFNFLVTIDVRQKDKLHLFLAFGQDW